ncbi:hypothetical protein Hanom_Chr09g00810251 [Helianthus anomalus]
MSCRSEHIWIEPIKGARKTSNFCWAIILCLGSLGFLLWNVGSGYDRFDIKDGIVCIFSWGFPGKKSSCLSPISYKRYSIHQNRS